MKKRVTLTNDQPTSPVWAAMRADVASQYRFAYALQEFLAGRALTVTCDKGDDDALTLCYADAAQLVEEQTGQRHSQPWRTETATTDAARADETNERALIGDRVAHLLRGMDMGDSYDVLRQTAGRFYAVELHDMQPHRTRGHRHASGMIRIFGATYIAIRYRHDAGMEYRVFDSVDRALMFLVAMFHVGNVAQAYKIPVRQRND